MQKENTPKFVVMQKSTKTIYTEKHAFIKNHTRKIKYMSTTIINVHEVHPSIFHYLQ